MTVANYNQVTIAGTLGADPQVKYTQSGQAVCELRLAINESWTDKATGQKKESTLWISVELWGKLAELAGQYLAKGKSVLIGGKLKEDSWTTTDGAKRSKVIVKGETMQFLGGKDRELQRQETSGEESQVLPDGGEIDNTDLPF